MSPASLAPTGLTDEELTLRPSRATDAPQIHALLQDPEVAIWWGANWSLDELADELDRALVIEVDEMVVGVLLCNEQHDRGCPSVSFDIALATPLHGRGLGRRALRLAIEHFIAKGHHRFTIDPVVTNQMAIRCYQAVGFRPVGILRACEQGPDGAWRDGLLMDLLAWELDEDPPTL